METPLLCPSEAHKYGGSTKSRNPQYGIRNPEFRLLVLPQIWRKHMAQTFVIEFCNKKPIVVFSGFINIYMSTFSHTRTVQIAKSQRVNYFFQPT